MNLSCSTTLVECTTINHQTIDIQPDKLENYLKLVESTKRNKDISNYDTLINEFFYPSEYTHGFLQKIKEESLVLNNFSTMDQYLSNLYTRNLLSDNFINSYKTIWDNLISYLKESNPNLLDFSNYVNNVKINLSSTNDCANDKLLLLKSLDIIFTLGQYYFNSYYKNELNLENRDKGLCDYWWGNLICSGVGVIVGTLWAGGIFAVSILISTAIGTVNPDAGTVVLVEGTLLALAIGISKGLSFYKTCCDEKIICKEPIGFYIKVLGCKDFVNNIYGHGLYLTTIWRNDNTQPNNIVTATPSLRLSVPISTQISEIFATISCYDDFNGNSYTFRKFDLFKSYADAPPYSLIWGNDPPSNASLYVQYPISVNVGSEGQFQLTWSVRPWGGSVTSTGSYSANLTFFGSGQKIVMAKLTNVCTGSNVIVSKTVIVN